MRCVARDRNHGVGRCQPKADLTPGVSLRGTCYVPVQLPTQHDQPVLTAQRGRSAAQESRACRQATHVAAAEPAAAARGGLHSGISIFLNTRAPTEPQVRGCSALQVAGGRAGRRRRA